MTGDAVVALDVGPREGAAPDDVVARPERNLDLEPIAPRVVLDHGRAFPGGHGAAVIFHHHEGAVVQQSGPFRYEDGVEVQDLSYLFPPDHDEEVCDGRRIETQFRVRRGPEVLDGPALDPDLRPAAEPGVELAVGLEGAEDQGLEIMVPGAGAGSAPRLGRADEAAAPAPVRVLPPAHLQGGVFRVPVAVDNPYRPFPGHFLVHDHFFHRTVVLPDPADVPGLPSARIEGDDRGFIPVGFLGKRPVNLHVRAGQGIQESVGIQGPRAVLFPDFGSQEVPERCRIGSHPGGRCVADAGSGGFENLSHRVLLIVTVSGGGGDGVPDFGYLVLSERDGRQEARYLVEREFEGLSHFVGRRVVP